MASICAFNWSKIKAVLVDLSGTLHIEDLVIDGAIAALEKLRGSGLPIRFVTNTTKETTNALHSRLNKLGFKIEKNEIYSSLLVARQLADERKLNPFLLIDPEAEEEFKGLDIYSDKHNAVFVGLAPTKFDYASLNTAFRLILNDNVPLIAVHRSRYYKRPDGLALGPGPYVAGLEYSTGVEAEIVGKPSELFFKGSIKGLNVEPHETVMIGDDAKDDIQGAVNAGFAGILVKTGKYRKNDERILPICGAPCHVSDNFSDAVDFLLNAIEKK